MMAGLQTADFSARQNRAVRWRRAATALFSSTLVILGVVATDAVADSPTRVFETRSGPGRGVSDGVVNRFLGIRYANSTAGANRWMPPTAPSRSHTIFEATTPGSACPQPIAQFSAQQPLSEDCLFLNVVTPVHSGDAEGLPVWIFMH